MSVGWTAQPPDFHLQVDKHTDAGDVVCVQFVNFSSEVYRCLVGQPVLQRFAPVESAKWSAGSLWKPFLPHTWPFVSVIIKYIQFSRTGPASCGRTGAETRRS